MFDGLKKILEEIKNISKSIDLYKKETIIQSLPAITFVNRAKKLIEQNKYTDAEALLKEAMSLPQKDALVYKYLGLVYEKTGRFALAVENYQISADLNPNDKNIWQRLGFALLSAKEYNKAEKAFENADKIQSGNSDTYTGWGMTFMKLKNYEQAREKFLQAAKINKYNYSAIFLSAVMEIKLGIYDQAENKLSFLVKVCPNENNTFEFARLKAIKNNIQDAIHYAEKSIQYNQNMLPAYILLGQLYAKIFDKENALNSFINAEQRGLLSANIYLEWGKVLTTFEMYNEAIEKLFKALNLEPENNNITAQLGLCFLSIGELDKAQPLLEKVLTKEPENIVVKQALGILNYEQKNFDTAIQILKTNDENAVNCFYLAKCYENLSNHEKTKDYYEAALNYNSKYITAYKNYIDYLISQKDYKNAQLKLRKALKINEENIDFLNQMFYVNYILVKENVYEYNIKETILIAETIENKGEDLFKYPELKQELVNLLQERNQS